MRPNHKYSVGFILLALSVVSSRALAHEDGAPPVYSPRAHALNGFRDVAHAQALNGFRDGSAAKALNGFRDGAQAQALNGFRAASTAQALNGFRDGAKVQALNGFRDASQAQALNGFRDVSQVQALNGFRDGSEARALNGFRDGSNAKALNGFRDSSQVQALNGFRDASQAQALNGFRDVSQTQALNGFRDGSEAWALNGFRDSSNAQALNGFRDASQAQALNGLADDPLAGWISSEPALQAERLELAHYIVQCAMSPGDDRAVTLDATTYTFRGVFGLLPGWAAGAKMTDSEYELLTACLGAHVNPLGAHVPISIRGPGVRLDAGEADLFPIREAAFFALHDGGGALATYACSADSGPHQGDDSRFCTEPGRCLSVIGVGSCRGICEDDEEGNFRCSMGGVDIPGVLTTYMQPKEG